MIKNFKKTLGNFSGIPGRIRGAFSRSKKKVSPEPTIENRIDTGKKVLMFGWELPPYNSGGLGVACHDMAEAIAKQNTEITFILPKKQPIASDFMKVDFAEDADSDFKSYLSKLKDRLASKGISVKEIDTLLSPYLTEDSYRDKLNQLLANSSLWQRFMALFGHPLYGDNLIGEVYRYGEAAAKVAKKEKFDVIHAHDWLAYPAGVRAKQVSKKPLVVHVHAMEYDRSQENAVDRRICEIERMGLEKADKVIAISHYVKNRVMQFYQIPESKIEVVHNGITIREKPQKKVSLKGLKSGGRKMVLSVGRITYQKGLDYFIDATAKAISIDPKIFLMIVGAGDMYHQIIRQAAAAGISDKVYFPGFLRGKELADLYKAADLFVMPSVSEPFGLVALEAMACKVPIILSKQSGAAEVIKHGLKVDFWDVDELANKMLAVLNHGSLRRSLANYGYKDAVDCSWDKAATKCLKIYSDLAKV